MTDAVAVDQLQALVARIERLEEDKAALAADIREVYGEAKAVGFDTKILRQVIKVRRMDREERQHQEALLTLYLDALSG